MSGGTLLVAMITATKKVEDGVIEFRDGIAAVAIAIGAPLDHESVPRILAHAFANYYTPRDWEPPSEDVGDADFLALEGRIRAWTARREALSGRFEDEVREAIRTL